jgi:CubicO group peptidase (beta-lactamase class C family)
MIVNWSATTKPISIMRCIFILIPVLFLCCSFSLLAQDTQTETPTADELDKLLKAYEEVHGFSGSFKLILQGTEYMEASYGLANRSFQIPNTSDTRFSINSISKAFTAVAVLQQVEKGNLYLENTVGSYLTELPELRSSWSDSVTLHHLLSHRAGLPRELGIQAHESPTFKEQIRLAAKLKLDTIPNTKYNYSNVGYMILGAVLERVTGKKYAKIIEEQIIKPLNLQNTGVYEGRKVVERQATPYVIQPGGAAETYRSKHQGDNAGGGLYSTPNDLALFIRALRNNTILGDSLAQKLFFPHTNANGEQEGYTFSIKQSGDSPMYMAAGSGYGTKSVILYTPKDGDFIALTSNWGNTPILQMLRDIFLTLEGQDVKPPSQDALATPNTYREWLGTYRFKEGELKAALNHPEDEIQIFEFEGKLFMDNEVLAEQEPNQLRLTYTQELQLFHQGNSLILTISGRRLEGKLIE